MNNKKVVARIVASSQAKVSNGGAVAGIVASQAQMNNGEAVAGIKGSFGWGR